MIALTSNGLQCLKRQLVRSSTNRSGSKVPNRGWSVSRYSEMILAAKPSEIETVVQKLMFSASKRSSQRCKVDTGRFVFIGRWPELWSASESSDTLAPSLSGDSLPPSKVVVGGRPVFKTVLENVSLGLEPHATACRQYVRFESQKMPDFGAT